MRFRKLIKIPLINLAVLGMIGGSSMIAHANTNHVHTSVISNINRNSVYKISAIRQGQSVRPRFATSNSRWRLNRSGFSTENDRSTRPFIYVYNNYAPNSRRAVVSKRIHFNGKWYWLTANRRVANKYPHAVDIYHYISRRAWKLISVGNHQFTNRRTTRRNYKRYKKHTYNRRRKATSNNEGLSQGLKYSNDGDDIIPKNRYWANKFVNEMKEQTLKDINNEREANGVSPLYESNNLDKIANMRAKQLHVHYGHYDPSTNRLYNAEDGYKLGFLGSPNENGYGENCGEDDLTNVLPSRAQNGKGMANYINDEMMNHDADSNWGHRKNILSPDYRVVGIGADYKPGQTFPFTLSEDFDYDDTGMNSNTPYPSVIQDPLQNMPKGSYVTYDANGDPTVHETDGTVTYHK